MQRHYNSQPKKQLISVIQGERHYNKYAVCKKNKYFKQPMLMMRMANITLSMNYKFLQCQNLIHHFPMPTFSSLLFFHFHFLSQRSMSNVKHQKGTTSINKECLQISSYFCVLKL